MTVGGGKKRRRAAYLKENVERQGKENACLRQCISICRVPEHFCKTRAAELHSVSLLYATSVYRALLIDAEHGLETRRLSGQLLSRPPLSHVRRLSVNACADLLRTAGKLEWPFRHAVGYTRGSSRPACVRQRIRARQEADERCTGMETEIRRDATCLKATSRPDGMHCRRAKR